MRAAQACFIAMPFEPKYDTVFLSADRFGRDDRDRLDQATALSMAASACSSFFTMAMYLSMLL